MIRDNHGEKEWILLNSKRQLSMLLWNKITIKKKATIRNGWKHWRTLFFSPNAHKTWLHVNFRKQFKIIVKFLRVSNLFTDHSFRSDPQIKKFVMDSFSCDQFCEYRNENKSKTMKTDVQ